MKNKLYVWTNFCPDWTDGLAFAIAQSEEEAKELVSINQGYDPQKEDWGELTVYELTAKLKIAYSVSGGS